MTRDSNDVDAGSRMHVLDWLESPRFLTDLRQFIKPTGLQIAEDSARQPKGRCDPGESDLAAFLTAEEHSNLRTWWLKHPKGSKLPTWDLAVSASTAEGTRALVLAEAKAHESELSDTGKQLAVRAAEEQQKRTNENHAQIGLAIAEASRAIARNHPGVSLSRDCSYQFCNRVAFAWKLASMGIPVALLYIAFIGDSMIAAPGDFFVSEQEWDDAFFDHIQGHFPADRVSRGIACGKASFWLIPHAMPVSRLSPPPGQRKTLR